MCARAGFAALPAAALEAVAALTHRRLELKGFDEQKLQALARRLWDATRTGAPAHRAHRLDEAIDAFASRGDRRVHIDR